MKKIFLTALFAVLGTALSARAQVAASTNDLILGFRATGGTGQTVNLEVNLGSASQFQGLSGTIVLSRLAANDLIATYGSGWATRSDLYWGVVGTAGRLSAGPGGSPVGTLWGTRAEDTPGTQSTPWIPASRDAQFNASSNIETLLAGAPGSLNGASATANSANASAITATLAGSYTYQDTLVQSGTSFGFFNPTIDNVVKPVSGSYAVSDLYELRVGATTATYLGSFGLKSDGSLTFSATASTFNGSTTLPTISAQPVSQTAAVGGSVTFSVTATGTGLTYQWFKNNVAIAGATASSYTIPAASAADAGSYSVAVTSASGGTITSTGSTLTVGAAANQGRLINLSVLTTIANATDNFTFGFVVGGAGTSGNKPMLMRAAGPALSTLNVPGVLSDPTMDFYNGSTKLTTNDNWGGDNSILTTAAAVGAFPYASATSKDAAIYQSAIPLGNDSVKISGVNGATGTVIAELYDATPTSQYNATTPRLINVSVLKAIGSGNTLGFIIGGTSPLKLLVRAIGPGLSAVNVNSGTAADPTLTVYNASNVAIASNNDWGTPVGTGAATAAQITTAANSVGAFAIPAGSKDAVMLLTLNPGLYTAQATLNPGTADGLAIIEVYEIP